MQNIGIVQIIELLLGGGILISLFKLVFKSGELYSKFAEFEKKFEKVENRCARFGGTVSKVDRRLTKIEEKVGQILKEKKLLKESPKKRFDKDF